MNTPGYVSPAKRINLFVLSDDNSPSSSEIDSQIDRIHLLTRIVVTDFTYKSICPLVNNLTGDDINIIADQSVSFDVTVWRLLHLKSNQFGVISTPAGTKGVVFRGKLQIDYDTPILSNRFPTTHQLVYLNQDLSPINSFRFEQLCLNCKPIPYLKEGYSLMKNSKVIICGITRDNIKRFPLIQIERTGRLFNDYRVVVFENDSTDGTKELLAKWKQDNNRVNVISKDFGITKRPSISFLAMARNKYLDYIFYHDFSGFDYVLMIDLDMDSWNLDGLANSFTYLDRYDVIAANGILNDIAMYDAFAFRSEQFPHNHRAPEYWSKIVKDIQKHYCQGSNPIPVYSAFGGMAIYKKKILEPVRYLSVDEDCEHVYLHKTIRNNGGKIVMNPSLTICQLGYS